MPDATDLINPGSLKFFRKKRGISQQQLADVIRCTKDTVSRWERGKIHHVRSRLRKPLCNALGVEWEQLTKDAGDTAELTTRFASFMWGGGIVKIPIRQDLRNLLQIVAERFNVDPGIVLGLAPLLFLIAAERSLLERNRRLDEMETALEEADERLFNNYAHLGMTSVRSGPEESLWEEVKSLEERDVFGRILTYKNWYEDEDPEGPFVHFIRDLVKGLPEDAVTDIQPAYSGMIGRYRIADDTLRKCTGISGDEESGRKLLDYIYSGNINLVKCLRAKRDKEEEEYRQWLSEELVRVEEDKQRLWQEMFPDGIPSSLQGGES